jgi:hypothetical protein
MLLLVMRSGADSEGRGSSGGEDYAAIASRLNVLYAGSQRITAEELRSLVFKKVRLADKRAGVLWCNGQVLNRTLWVGT